MPHVAHGGAEALGQVIAGHGLHGEQGQQRIAQGHVVILPAGRPAVVCCPGRIGDPHHCNGPRVIYLCP
ncbi:hypothetical protein ACFFX0_19805 [Citricoccus parietis]|uniref:Uncharacterized protein n=1 Tax=Citricoccus parietis TaxID=592307 RepID=A0ABV5G318_9MICC